MTLAKSASAPGLGGSLKTAGRGMTSNPPGVFTVYDKMLQKGMFKDRILPALRAAGTSNAVAAETAQQCLMPEICNPAPPTPSAEKKFRRNLTAGDITVHHGLADQTLPPKDFRYGMTLPRGPGAAAAIKAGLKVGYAAYQDAKREEKYASSRMEPLGCSINRHYENAEVILKPEKGFGCPSGIPESAKLAIWPTDVVPDGPEVKALYAYTHGNVDPGERKDRQYELPEECKDPFFRYGISMRVPGAPGEKCRLALDMSVADDGSIPKTVFVQRECEDYRNVHNTELGGKVNHKQGKVPLPPGHRFGIKSASSGDCAQAVIQGAYELEEQLPDQDLGCCLKPGRRNYTTETRAFGTPSIRTDLVPPAKRSVADQRSFGDEATTAILLNPQRFDAIGVPDREFLLRRPKEELKALVAGTGRNLSDAEFSGIYDQAAGLFGDGLDVVSLDAFLFVYSARIDEQVKREIG